MKYIDNTQRFEVILYELNSKNILMEKSQEK
jgi:hypothetical protein